MSNEKNTQNRRDFLKISGLGALAAVAAGKILSTPSAARAQGGAKLEMVKPTEPMAMSLGYVEDAKKTDVKKFPKRAGAAGAKQYCYNCQFYQSKEKDRSKTASAPCTIFQGKGVASHGWCNSWVQDPNVKN